MTFQIHVNCQLQRTANALTILVVVACLGGGGGLIFPCIMLFITYLFLTNVEV